MAPPPHSTGPGVTCVDGVRRNAPHPRGGTKRWRPPIKDQDMKNPQVSGLSSEPMLWGGMGVGRLQGEITHLASPEPW
ncbi:hypothetical protein GUJ93_ZPchr0011g27257 [Zizania palustris]|uniref:Uncharacterized protein n=1 Tax=Zizania palustris TaxID=103762 RepID=A0A8J6BKN7_ZIZPA|nr:hypothetical protein GUJ93_ZPchr0011g27257 [Zizania palustris]